jgi:hypothetical protein
MEESPPTKPYRFYRLQADGHIIDGQWLEFESREAALEHASKMADDHVVVEVWDGAERLGVFKPAGEEL